MKVYYYMNVTGFSNCYLVVNEKQKEAVIIDPGEVTENLISQIEDNHFNLTAILVTHNHGSHVKGISTLRKIYTPKIFAADWEVAGSQTNVITGDGTIDVAGMNIKYMAVPGHTSDSVVYKIGNMIFTGDVLFAGTMGSTNSSYSKVILKSNVENKIFTQEDDCIIMPGHGPLSSLGAVKEFNYGL